MNKLYRGIRRGQDAIVYVDEVEISLTEAKRLHPSEATVEFGYFGDGPSQTALAILYDAIKDLPNADELSLTYYQDFKFDFIANVQYHVGFSILQSQIKEWLNKRLENGPEDRKGWLI